MSDTIERSQTHASFTVERSYPVSATILWRALSDADARAQWFGGDGNEAFTVADKGHDFRVGGHTVEEGQWHGGPRSRFDATYTDIVEQQRMVFSYDLWIDDQHLSTSLTTIALEPDGDRTRLTYTEQAVYYDGLDTGEVREQGTNGILDQLGAYLATVS